MDDLRLPVAVVTTDEGIRFLECDELDGILIDRVSGEELELVSVVMVIGLPELAA